MGWGVIFPLDSEKATLYLENELFENKSNAFTNEHSIGFIWHFISQRRRKSAGKRRKG